jgi:hypothetical protein
MVDSHHISQTGQYGGFSPYPPNQPIWWIFTISAKPADTVEFHHIRQTGGYGGFSPYPIILLLQVYGQQ